MFYIKNFPNLILRLVTLDRYYICDECRKIHRRDGHEIRLDDGELPLKANRWWYGSVCRKGFNKSMDRAIHALRQGLIEG